MGDAARERDGTPLHDLAEVGRGSTWGVYVSRGEERASADQGVEGLHQSENRFNHVTQPERLHQPEKRVSGSLSFLRGGTTSPNTTHMHARNQENPPRGKRLCVTGASRVFSHHSTDPAETCLTSLFGMGSGVPRVI